MRNLEDDPDVRLELGDRRWDARGRVIEDAEEAATARRLLFAKYAPGYRGSLEAWRDGALPVAVDLPQPPPG